MTRAPKSELREYTSISEADREFLHSAYLENKLNLRTYLVSRFEMHHHDVQDVLQETFIRTARALPRIDRTRITGWLYRTAHHTACNYIRNNKRIRQAVDVESTQIPADEPGILSHLEKQEWHSHLKRAFDRIPKHQRRMLRFHAQGLEPQEIGRKVNLETWAVREQIDLIKKALHNYIYNASS